MQILQKNGWRTGASGKVHFHPHFAGLYDQSLDFDRALSRLYRSGEAGLMFRCRKQPKALWSRMCFLTPWK